MTKNYHGSNEITTSGHTGWSLLARKMAANMREATCARTKTSKVPTRVALLYLSYSVAVSKTEENSRENRLPNCVQFVQRLIKELSHQGLLNLHL